MNKLITLIFFGLLCSTSLLAMSEDQAKFLAQHQEALALSGHVLNREMVSNAPWPKVTIYMKVAATPEEAIALFSDFERQKDYVPNLLESKVVKQLSPSEVHTKYELKMPWPLSNSHYIHGTIIDHHASTYSIRWYMVESDSIDKVEGKATFLSYKNQTLMIYESLIYPKSFLARLFAGSMVSDTEASTLAVKKFIEEESKQKKESYQHSLDQLRRSLAGELVFVKKNNKQPVFIFTTFIIEAL